MICKRMFQNLPNFFSTRWTFSTFLAIFSPIFHKQGGHFQHFNWEIILNIIFSFFGASNQFLLGKLAFLTQIFAYHRSTGIRRVLACRISFEIMRGVPGLFESISSYFSTSFLKALPQTSGS